MKPVRKHPWDLAPRQAAALQHKLASCVQLAPACDLRRITLVAGADVSYSKRTDTCYGAVIVWDWRRRTVVAQSTAVRPSRFPYVPGLLSFREAPVLLDALAELPARPDLMVVEGHGLSHPRRFGLACHLGILFDLPSVGCAKTRLVGRHREPGPERGDHTPLYHEGIIVGSVLRTRSGVKPVYASQGHAVSLPQCRRALLQLTGCYRLPEPLRLAHALANRKRRIREST